MGRARARGTHGRAGREGGEAGWREKDTGRTGRGLLKVGKNERASERDESRRGT